jgi:hypothetical protein
MAKSQAAFPSMINFGSRDFINFSNLIDEQS